MYTDCDRGNTPRVALDLRCRLVKTAGLLAVCLVALVCIGNASAATSPVDPTLLADAASSPAKSEKVIILSDKAVAGATDAFNKASAVKDGYGAGTLRSQLPLVGGVAVTLPAARMTTLAKMSGLTVSPDSTLRQTAFDNYSNVQLWPYLSGIAHLWTYQWNPAPPTPTIAVVDSGVSTSVPDMANRLLIPQVNLCTLAPNSAGDGDGHGTFVSSILAGVGSGHVGAAPNGKLISLDVINDQGMATTSDVIAAAQWIVDHRYQYNIKVANFSLQSTTPSHFVNDPLDKAVEKLWLSGVVVVTAAGNYDVNGQSTAVRYAPANDPFVITVGALDNKGTLNRSDDIAAPWSTWGYTLDGFAKPDIGASGRYMIGAVPAGSTLLSTFPNNVYAPGYLQLSGTSFAAPVVAGAAAQLLALHPELTPDQVKGALMLGADQTPAATPGSLGVGELNVAKSASLLGGTLPNPNAALENYLVYNWTVSTIPYFDGNSWETTIASNPSGWDSSSWETKWWTSASQETKWWTSVAWETKWWTSTSTIDVAWAAQSQTDLTNEVAAQGEKSSNPDLLTNSDFKALLIDPLLAPAP
ncbi:MAG: S8 family serine peptidase [Gaiellaceae bacterium]